ncbi:DUF3861 domain-containing protein [Mesonia sp.]|uniref:DUF3861 domain-containing protein n=1 Tax=Mesonia sp. TaxID=1960830 RepID=UPI001771F4DE|nr:DUF3861 domain-containing protein [Mesonia sp.]HIB38306.1 DUF3861 family protein [Mesonia sp.]HIO27511.1 DUF3861 family protein [Flavobacteriaceae bacterium]
MAKKNNQYQLTLEQVSLKDESLKQEQPISFEFENHDEIFQVIEKVEEKQLFENKNDSKELVLGLKLFTEVMLRHRKHPLFEEIAPEIAKFMKKLKSS